jgi:predicted RNase H-like nuclease (RuvC/YqgF family)
MSSAHNSDNEEYIAPAPAFCKRIRTEDLQSEVVKTTREGLEQLYEEVVDKLDTNKKDKKDSKEQATYMKMIQQAKLVESIDEFFIADEDRQKAKFMNMLIENNRNVDRIAKYEEKIGAMEKTIEELREKEDHLNDVLEGCKECEEDYKTNLRKYRDRVIIQETIIKDLKCKIKTKNTYLVQIVLVFGAFLFYHFYK